MIAIMQWHNRIITVLKLTLTVEIQALFVVQSATIAQSLSLTLFASAVFRRPHKILTTQLWLLSFTGTYIPKLTELAKLRVLYVFPLATIASDRHVSELELTMILSLRYGESQPGLQPATRSSVAPH